MSEPTAQPFDLVKAVAARLDQLAERWAAGGEFQAEDFLTLQAARKVLDAYVALHPEEFEGEPRPSEED